MLCIVYVDDFKVAGPKGGVAQTWKDIVEKSNIGITEPEESTHFLGCKHHVETKTVDGKEIKYIQYDMEKFLSSCCDTYEKLATDSGQKVRKKCQLLSLMKLTGKTSPADQ